MRSRWKVLCGATMVALALATLPGPARAAVNPGQRASDDPVRILRIYYQAPVLVKAGEPVTMPVQVVCVTARGHACEATLSLGVRAGTGDVWRFHRVGAEPELSFDLSAPAARAAASPAGHDVAFALRAQAGNVTTSLPAGNAGPPLRFYAAHEIRPVSVPAVPFGHVRKGRTVLSLPWGSGPKRAGLALGRESPTLGPPAFDVDRAGNLHLLDALQHRIARFKGNRLLGERFIGMNPDSDLALAAGGAAFVTQAHKGTLGVRSLSPAGRDSGAASLGQAVLSQVRVAGSIAYAELLPLDAWVRVPTPGSHGSRLTPITGRPLPSGERLLRVGTERYVRLGIVRDGRVHKAVELRSDQRFGEVALAEPDGSGGYVVVVRTWQWWPKPADQFQVIHVSEGRVAETFAVSSRGFANTRPLSRFRLGPGGRLYQLVTRSSGVRIVRFQLKGES